MLWRDLRMCSREQNDWRGDDLIRGENGSSDGRFVADEDAQIEPRAFQTAMSGGKSESDRDVRGGERRVHVTRTLTDFPRVSQAGDVEIVERGANGSRCGASRDGAAGERRFERQHRA